MGIPQIFEPGDYSVAVKKKRANPPRPWRWEIYRAGRSSPVEQSAAYFETMATAQRAGREALALFLAKRHA
jgi:hypothetical protein